MTLAPNNIFPFFINLDSIANYVCFDFVYAEKFNKTGDTFSFNFISNNNDYTNIDFPTPVYPVIKVGIYSLINTYIIY